MLRMLFAPLTVLVELKLFLGIFLVFPRIIINPVADRAFHLNDVFTVLGSHVNIVRLCDKNCNTRNLVSITEPMARIELATYSFAYTSPFLALQGGLDCILFRYYIGAPCQSFGPRLAGPRS